MTQAAALFASLFSVLVPAKMWFAPGQPDNIEVKSKGEVTLVLTDFEGKPFESKASADVTSGKTVDAKSIFPAMSTLGTYVLYAVPKGKSLPEFEGTPLVIEVRGQKDGGAEPQVTRVQPLQYALIQTQHGPITAVFYYDVAPNTVDNFLTLASQGYFDGLTFHRIVKGFVIQGGDPQGNGRGGPGYSIPAEFNARPHEAGVLSMARATDPNSAGSQFFICLDYTNTKQLDGKYTAFGKVVDGMKAVNEIANTPTDGETPTTPQVMDAVSVKPVTAQDNPYESIIHLKK